MSEWPANTIDIRACPVCQGRGTVTIAGNRLECYVCHGRKFVEVRPPLVFVVRDATMEESAPEARE